MNLKLKLYLGLYKIQSNRMIRLAHSLFQDEMNPEGIKFVKLYEKKLEQFEKVQCSVVNLELHIIKLEKQYMLRK